MSKRLLVALLLVLAAAVAVLPGGVAVAETKMNFYVIAHAGPGDPFWAVVQRGVQDAGKTLGVQAVFQGPAQYNVAEQVNMFNAAVSGNAAGIAVTISDVNAWVNPITRAREKGIPVIAINAKEPPGTTVNIPYMAYIGMDEYVAGKMIGARTVAKLKTGERAVVVNHQPGHIGLEARTKGIKEVLEGLRGKVEVLDITQDPTKAYGILKSYLRAHPETKAIFALGPLGAIPTIKLVIEESLAGKIIVTSFDLDSNTVKAIKDGVVDATVDQQQYLQGYMAITELFLYAKFGLAPTDYDTGRGLVTKENVGLVEGLVKQGYR